MIERLIHTSMERSIPLVIIYQSSKGISQRTIQVKSIHGEYIKAFCYTRGEYRTFKTENILAAELDYKKGGHPISIGRPNAFYKSFGC